MVTKLFKFSFIWCAIALSSPALGAANSESMTLAFEECIARREAVITQLGISASNIIPIVNTSVMTMTKLCTADGSLIVTCSKPDNKMVLTQSTNHCN